MVFITGNKCATRRSISEQRNDFPGVDFSEVQNDADVLSARIKSEMMDPMAKKRVHDLLGWIFNRCHSLLNLHLSSPYKFDFILFSPRIRLRSGINLNCCWAFRMQILSSHSVLDGLSQFWYGSLLF